MVGGTTRVVRPSAGASTLLIISYIRDMRKKLLVATLFLLAVGRLFAQQPVQSRSDLEKERAAIQKEIEDVKRTLDETHKNKRETLGQLALLQRRLHLRESAIRNIN